MRVLRKVADGREGDTHDDATEVLPPWREKDEESPPEAEKVMTGTLKH